MFVVINASTQYLLPGWVSVCVCMWVCVLLYMYICYQIYMYKMCGRVCVCVCERGSFVSERKIQRVSE